MSFVASAKTAEEKHQDPNDDQPYDFIFTVGDDRVDEFCFEIPPERLAADASKFYCLVNYRETSKANYYLQGW